ncbi:AAA family ATPase [Candidatus Woesearchaeota archaeon]|nr:AAA family ATPase [Candidatus Woesearchaeota archaeon]
MQVDETPEKLDFNDDFKKAFNLIENTKRNLFITGKAGTGKSTLLKYFTANTKKNVVVVAPTGLAAVNVEGQTLHSFFKFPPTLITKDDIKKNRGNVYRWIDTLIIDEISNVRVDILDAADKVMRQNGRNKNEPFGGAQIVFFGDLYQLPPVVDRAASPFIEDSYGTPYFFSLNVIKELDLKIVELAKIYRQKDQEFIHILDKIRTGKLSEEDLNKLNERVTEEVSSDEYVNLVPTNYLAKIINCKKLDALSGSIYTYKAKLEGEFKPTTNNLPAELELQLKEGARVIFVKNHPHEFWVNGTMGRVISLGPDWVKVKLDGTEEVVQVTSATWEKYKYAYDCESKELIKEKIGKFKQIPLRLAWAMTIHKSQGQTFNKLVLDTSPGIWESGQLYVALSRCRTLEGLFLKTPIWMNDIKIDSRVTEFLNNYKEVDK